jgi:hypothetical protein
MKKVILLSVLFLFTLNLTGQEKYYATWAREAFVDRDYFGAKKYYLNALAFDTANSEYLLGLGLAYQELYALDSAVYYLTKVKSSGNYAATPEVDFYLARCEKMRGNYEEAHGLFAYFFRNYRGSDIYLKAFAKKEIDQRNQIKEILGDTINVELFEFPAPINSTVADFAGTFLNDSMLLYTSLDGDSVMLNNRKSAELYLSRKADSIWVSREKLKMIKQNKKADYANPFFDIKDSVLYFSVCPPDQPCNIFEAKLDSSKKWQTKALPETINFPEANNTQPMVFYQGERKYILFSSNTPTGKGKQDIWISEFDKVWKAAVNLGNDVNSKGNELTPYYFNDTLYFASDWHPNIGGFDLFKTPFKNGKVRGVVQNLGIPFNSVGNDLYMAPYDSISGVFTSNRSGIYAQTTICCNDLFAYKKLPAQPSKSAEEVVKYQLIALLDHIPVKLFFHNDRPMEDSWDTISIYNYLETYVKYIARKDEYKREFSKLFNKDLKDSSYHAIDSFFVNNVEKGLIDLEYFSDTIYNILEKGFSIRITVRGFASPLAKNDYNINLSKRRINSFKKYLEQYPKGNFNQYLADTASNGARLEIVRVPNGEELSNPYVSDNYYDTRKSIFHPAAAYERRVEVEDLILIDDENKLPLVAFKGAQKFKLDLGKLDSLYTEHEIILQNQLFEKLNLISAEASCGCTNIGAFNGEIEPLHRSKIKFSIQKEAPGSYLSEIIFKDVSGKEFILEVYFEI